MKWSKPMLCWCKVDIRVDCVCIWRSVMLDGVQSSVMGL